MMRLALDNASVVRVSSPTFVGRREQLEHARDTLERAVSGRPTFVVVAGDAGAGKTRFVDEVARRAEPGGWRTLIGACVEMGDDTLPYAPIVNALRRFADVVGRTELEKLLGPGSSELSRLVPDLVRSPSATSGEAEITTVSSQGRLLEALLALFGAFAALVVAEQNHIPLAAHRFDQAVCGELSSVVVVGGDVSDDLALIV